MAVALANVADAAYAILSPMWVELSFLLVFLLGCALLRLDLLGEKPRSHKKVEEPGAAPLFEGRLRKAIEAAAAAE
eukprot:CAMPEP_0198541136 /NCGR_PEP_ID=MMETSP1462-20131121/53586_1 /TAXON_ID=1333877 /ORGANISM="Brandtodinium nutriculum, Strain RCC3387" /LENGTH=75 /DNA_ID=CAMNT_0044271287 /DNA_START=179 /DNA_END=403 /DNA_ORIENTATION=-